MYAQYVSLVPNDVIYPTSIVRSKGCVQRLERLREMSPYGIRRKGKSHSSSHHTTSQIQLYLKHLKLFLLPPWPATFSCPYLTVLILSYPSQKPRNHFLFLYFIHPLYSSYQKVLLIDYLKQISSLHFSPCQLT